MDATLGISALSRPCAGKQLGAGAFGTVHKAKSLETGKSPFTASARGAGACPPGTPPHWPRLRSQAHQQGAGRVAGDSAAASRGPDHADAPPPQHHQCALRAPRRRPRRGSGPGPGNLTSSAGLTRLRDGRVRGLLRGRVQAVHRHGPGQRGRAAHHDFGEGVAAASAHVGACGASAPP